MNHPKFPMKAKQQRSGNEIWEKRPDVKPEEMIAWALTEVAAATASELGIKDAATPMGAMEGLGTRIEGWLDACDRIALAMISPRTGPAR